MHIDYATGQDTTVHTLMSRDGAILDSGYFYSPYVPMMTESSRNFKPQTRMSRRYRREQFRESFITDARPHYTFLQRLFLFFR